MRLFVGVWPPAEVQAVLATAGHRDTPGLRWTAPERWHVTLAFLGEVPDSDLETCTSALHTAAGHLAGPPEAVLGPATTVLGRAVLCVPVAGLEAAADAVRTTMTGLGLTVDPTPYRGHLTLARARGKGRRIQPGAAGAPLAARWVVDELCLVASAAGPHGHRYRTLAAATVP
jgi:RNA 2',3'-cyclic 3'-phosphodiesterase